MALTETVALVFLAYMIVPVFAYLLWLLYGFVRDLARKGKSSEPGPDGTE